MYSESIVDRRLWQLERTYSVRLHRYPVDESISISNALTLPDSPDCAYSDKGVQTRSLTRDEQDFVWNEWNLAAIDFRYFAERYVQIILDDALGKRGHIKFTPAQELILKRMARTEERLWLEMDQGHDRFDGQCYFMHKAGAMGISTHSELVGVHLCNFYPDTMGMVASTNDEKVQKVYTDYHLSVYDSLPPWMRSPLRSKTKDRGLDFLSGSQVILQDASQKSGLGQGAKWHFVHVTELASWPDPVSQFEKHLMPRISWSIRGTCFAESNSQGMHDWWHDHTELARRGEYNRWQYIFIGWWMVPQFRHRYPPDGWVPAQHTVEEEKLIISRSPEFNDGVVFHPTSEMMFWWESERHTYEINGTLNEFYKEHPSVPEQSFTHSGKSSWPVEVLERLQRGCQEPITCYEIATKSIPSEIVITEPQLVEITPGSGKYIQTPPPKIHTIQNKYDLVPIRVDIRDLNRDPRGLILIYEQPSNRHDYFGGVDTCGGIGNWSRWLKRSRDRRNDNGVVEIIRRGFYGGPDVQVCEFAAPLLPQDLALYVSCLGRLYTGREEDGCLMTVEINLWGSTCQTELMERYGYDNLYIRRNTTDGVVVKFAENYGFHTNHSSIRRLWAAGKKHHAASRFIARSTFLVTEMRDCTDDDIHDKLSQGHVKPSKGTGSKQEGSSRHDDRVYAKLFALEGAHSFTDGMWSDPDPKIKPVMEMTDGSPRRMSFADRDYTYAEHQTMLADWEAELGEL